MLDEYVAVRSQWFPGRKAVFRLRLYDSALGRIAIVNDPYRQPRVWLSSIIGEVIAHLNACYGPIARLFEEMVPPTANDPSPFHEALFHPDCGRNVQWKRQTRAHVEELTFMAVRPHRKEDEPAWLELEFQSAPLAMSERGEHDLGRIDERQREAAWLASLTMRASEVEYHGIFDWRNVARVVVVGLTGVRLLTHHVKHSPSGLGWAYCGSGPADLARSLLIDALDLQPVRDPLCDIIVFPPIEKFYHRFKIEVVSKLGDSVNDPFVLRHWDVREWYMRQDRPRFCFVHPFEEIQGDAACHYCEHPDELVSLSL